MPLIKDGAFVEDPWIRVDDEEAPLPDEGPLLVPLARWEAMRETLLKRNHALGVLLKPGEEPKRLAEDLGRLDLVALEFPVFKDGRAFSYARLLRERYGFEGEIRAVGHILRDQFLFLARCGVNAVEVKEGATLEDWEEALSEFSVWYQPATDKRPTARSLRERLAARAEEA